MLPTFLIMFREGLEISLILSILLVATRGIAGRGRWIAGGIAGGIAGSAIVAFFAESISMAFEGTGQELFNASIMLLAATMIGWTVVWMQQHGRELAQRIKHMGKAISDGEKPLYALAVLVSLTMWREGSEIVLFTYGVLGASQEPLIAIIGGGLAGLATAATIGTMIYFGLLKISPRYIFSTTGWLLALLAAGMSAQAAGFLNAAGHLPVLVPELWDTSAILSESSLTGRILHALVGYIDRPSGIQMVFYVATLAIIAALVKITRANGQRPGKNSPAATAA